MERLAVRINELKNEINESKNSLKQFHKEKVRLEKERSVQKEKIELWTEKCSELQMLKFGRLIDLDMLEEGNDKTKEREDEQQIKEVEMNHINEMKKLEIEFEKLNNEFAEVICFCFYTHLFIYFLILILSDEFRLLKQIQFIFSQSQHLQIVNYKSHMK